MGGFDLLVGRELSAAGIRNALASATGAPEAQVAVVDGYPLRPLPEATSVLCMHRAAGGDFPTLLSIELLGDGLSRPFQAIAQGISRVADCDCLFPDADLNPFAFVLLSPGADPRRVFLDAEAYDRDEYRLSRQSPAP
jgi:hypothetical protein